MSEIYLLEHTHQFREFERVYAPVAAYNAYQREWLRKRMTGTVERYLRFIETAKSLDYPVKVRFGFEVCYIPETADILAGILSDTAGCGADVLTGSAHWIDGWGFDHPGQRELWKSADVNGVYRRYYEIMSELCESGLFGGIAHPDSIKCFGYTPDFDLSDTYAELAGLIVKRGM